MEQHAQPHCVVSHAGDHAQLNIRGSTVWDCFFARRLNEKPPCEQKTVDQNIRSLSCAKWLCFLTVVLVDVQTDGFSMHMTIHRNTAKRSVEQMGLDVDRESVTRPAQQMMVTRETAMYEDGMCSSTQPFCDPSDQMAVNKGSRQCDVQCPQVWVTTTFLT